MVRITNNLEKNYHNVKTVNVVTRIFGRIVGQRAPEDFKVLRSINLNESFTHYYIHRHDYVISFKNNSVQSIYRCTEKG